MNIKKLVCAFMIMATAAYGQQPPSAFNYQGTLTRFGTVASGTYDFQFVLKDAANSGNSLATNLIPQVLVSNGLFTTTLDFGTGPFSSGAQRWVEILVRTNGGSAYAVLTPRQPVSPSPYALGAFSLVGSRQVGTNVGLGGVAMSSSNYSRLRSSTPTWVNVTNLVVTLATSGRPVMISLGTADPSQSANIGIVRNGEISPPVPIHAVGGVRVLRGNNPVWDSALVLRAGLSGFGDNLLNMNLPPSAFSGIDTAPAGTNTYSVQVIVYDPGHEIDVQNVRLVAYEL